MNDATNEAISYVMDVMFFLEKADDCVEFPEEKVTCEDLYKGMSSVTNHLIEQDAVLSELKVIIHDLMFTIDELEKALGKTINPT